MLRKQSEIHPTPIGTTHDREERRPDLLTVGRLSLSLSQKQRFRFGLEVANTVLGFLSASYLDRRS